MVMAVPLLVAALAVVIEVGRISLARARLQAAADRAAFAGAAAVAHALNGVAAENWRIHRAFRDLARDFAADTQQDHDTAKQRFAGYEAARDAAFDAIDGIRTAMPDHVRRAALSLLSENAPRAMGDVSLPGGIELRDDADSAAQWGRPSYGSVTGPLFTDPEGIDSGAFDALKYFIKRRAPDTVVGVAAHEIMEPMLLKGVLGRGVEIQAVSAAQAFGGSIEEFARKETETLEEAEGAIAPDGSDALYRAATVPAWTLGEPWAGMRH